MFVTVNDVPQQTRNLDSGAPSAAFAPVPDDPGNHVLEIGGSSSAESGFQGAIAAVLLAPDLTPNPQTVDYLKSKWGPFP
jgi:hypothetical protein